MTNSKEIEERVFTINYITWNCHTQHEHPSPSNMGNQVKYPSVVPTSQTKLTIHVIVVFKGWFHAFGFNSKLKLKSNS